MLGLIADHVIDNIPFDPDMSWLKKRLRVKEKSTNDAELAMMVEKARPIARPRVYYQVSSIGERSDNWMEINGVRFTSRVLCVNLDDSHRVFPYLVSCGPELQEWADSFDDVLLNFWAEAVKEAALFCAIRVFSEDLDDRYHPGRTASMSPGSLQDWPIQQQVPLFSLLGEGPKRIGVHLSDSLLMTPTKSVSGICFTTETDFDSCQLCPREGCPGRRAIYNREMYDSRYCRQNGLPKEMFQ